MILPKLLWMVGRTWRGTIKIENSVFLFSIYSIISMFSYFRLVYRRFSLTEGGISDISYYVRL
jgi:hypothetical protein